eukprot:gnl/Spiro4/12832_TR6798_c0_g1_i1.p1 gnl/Spiro4/12832_TR6798_c0_g1~~gnl/Spiro4/12832_TR6798_c0_g1_i1.p1  ORF type:complete len:483 (+),score=89.51 gnl/Spiro4/12832_TR6798_c0_g1_i1:87-1535(+)
MAMSLTLGSDEPSRAVAIVALLAGLNPSKGEQQLRLDSVQGISTEPNTICKYLAQAHAFAGKPQQQPEIDQWLSLANTQLRVGKSKEAVLGVLHGLNKHLLPRTFLVGDSLTIADVVMFSALFSYILSLSSDEIANSVNVVRWFNYMTRVLPSTEDQQSARAFVAHPSTQLFRSEFFQQPPPPPATTPAAANSSDASSRKQAHAAATHSHAAHTSAAVRATSAATRSTTKASTKATTTTTTTTATTTTADSDEAKAARAAKAEANRAKGLALKAAKEAAGPKPPKAKGKAEQTAPSQPKPPPAAAKAKAEPAVPPTVSEAPSMFAAAHLEVGRIVDVAEIPKSPKCYKLQIVGGGCTRQAVAGLKQFLTPEELLNRCVVTITNLPPRKIVGVESQCMVLAGSHADIVRPLVPPVDSAPGDRVHLLHHAPSDNCPQAVDVDLWFRIVAGLHCQGGRPTLVGIPLVSTRGDVLLPDLPDGAEIH